MTPQGFVWYEGGYESYRAKRREAQSERPVREEKPKTENAFHRTKKQHDINKDKWIGVGGHAEGTEGPEDCLLREVKEETGLTLTSYQFRGLITFISDEAPEPEEMCLFTADGFTGELIECNEGDLQWMDKKEVLALPTWEGDAIFLKLLIEEDEHRFFTLRLVYEGSKLVEKQLYRYS